MAEYIDRTALAEKLLGLAVHYTEQGRIEAAKNYNWAITLLMAAPTVDIAQVKHGRWIYNAFYDAWRCSECNAGSDEATGFCPNCGARMDGGADNG